MMKKSILILGLFAVAGSANAVFNYTGGTMSENFDGITSATINNFLSPTVGVQTAVTGSTFDAAKVAGTGATGMNFIADDGTSNAGSLRSLGQVGNGERALGMLASGTNVPGIGVEIRNMTGLSLTSITITFTQENWRSSTSQVNTMAASWGRTGGGMTSADYITNAGMTAEANLNLVGPAPVTANGALNGNDPLNQALRTHTFTLSTPLAAGDSFFVRWVDNDNTGSDAALAIDNLTIAATAVPEPATMAALGLGVAALLRRRRK